MPVSNFSTDDCVPMSVLVLNKKVCGKCAVPHKTELNFEREVTTDITCTDYSTQIAINVSSVLDMNSHNIFTNSSFL